MRKHGAKGFFLFSEQEKDGEGCPSMRLHGIITQKGKLRRPVRRKGNDMQPIQSNRLQLNRMPQKSDVFLAAALGLAAFFLWNHPDIIETAQHTRILLDDVFSGRFFAFYQDTMDARATLGYANAAHYHIWFYLLCGLWDLPLYLIGKLIPVGELAFTLWTKALGATAFVACGLVLRRLAEKLGAGREQIAWTPWFFWLCPVGFFSALCMGQYDSLCLLFLLLGMLFYLDGRMLPFVLTMGTALVFKMFAIFILIPLLLLREKRILRIAGWLALSLWLYLPGSLLFARRNGDAGFFNSLIAQRLFATVLPTVGQPSLLLVLLAGLYLLCWLWQPGSEESLAQKAVYVCLTVFSLLFLLVQWHPQWIILLSPFLLLTTWQTKKQMPWLLLSGICFAGYFLLTAYSFAGQIEGNLLDFGLLGQLTGLRISGSEQLRINTIYFDLVPYLSQLAPVAFAAPLLAGLVGKLPLRGSCLADRLDHRPVNPQPLWLWAYGTFAVCWGCVWLVPSLFGWCKTLGIL